MARLKRAGRLRGLSLAIGSAAVAGLVHGTIVWAMPGPAAAIAMTLVSMAVIALGGVSSARASRFAALATAGMMTACFMALRCAAGVALGGELAAFRIGLEVAGIAVAAATSTLIGRDSAA